MASSRTYAGKVLSTQVKRASSVVLPSRLARIVEGAYSGGGSKANKQIKQTKQYFNLTGAKGLLLLVHDGNYSLEPSTVLHLVDRVLGNRHSGINSVVYFTVNMSAAVPGVDRDMKFSGSMRIVWASPAFPRNSSRHFKKDGWPFMKGRLESQSRRSVKDQSTESNSKDHKGFRCEAHSPTSAINSAPVAQGRAESRRERSCKPYDNTGTRSGEARLLGRSVKACDFRRCAANLILQSDTDCSCRANT